MMSIRIIVPDQSRVDPFSGKRARDRNEPTTNREPQQSCEPGDRAELPHQAETNKAVALGRDGAAPSSLASTANRMTATESLFFGTINDFRNKIGTKRTCRGELWMSALGGEADVD